MAHRFNPPPNWPAVPAGWTPPPNWQPPADWPPAPPAWPFWIAEPTPAAAPVGPLVSAPVAAVAVPAAVPVAAPRPTPAPRPVVALPPGLPEHEDGSGGVFGARKRLRAAETELTAATEQNRELRRALEKLAGDYATLRGKDAVALDQEIRDTQIRLAQLTQQVATEQTAARQSQVDAEARLADVRRQAIEAELELAATRRGIVQTEELALLQEAGIYEYKHPLADSVAYKAALAQLKDSIKVCVRNNHAITATTNWTVNNSRVEGERMVRDFSKLMLRAYNAEADNSVRSMKPHRLDTAVDRLGKTRETIVRLGKTMNIAISAAYHELRLRELALTADYLAKVDEEKERVRAERERQRDEKQAQLEFAREKAKLAKEMAHWQNARAKYLAEGNVEQVTKADTELAEIDESVRSVEAREGNIRTGWVYVISNVGSFGEDVVKIGLTRRFDPMERVRELGDASVPFKFDVHGLIFHSDAVSLETKLHQTLADRRVNRVNLRREFFRATPAEVLAVLTELGLDNQVVDYTEEPEALEWRSSRSAVEPQPV
jgi:hypothetical protein